MFDRLGVEWQYPILTGHGTKPEDLFGVRWQNWQDDVEKAYQQLRQVHDSVVIVALSMGTLLSIELAVKHSTEIKGLVLISPAVRFYNKLAPLTPFIRPILKKFPFPSKDKFSSAEYAKNDRGYPWFPTATYESFWRQTKTIFRTAAQVRCPVRIIQSRHDHTADPRGAQRLLDILSGPKEIFWHEQSGHEMLIDCEAGQVVQEIMSFPPLTVNT